MGKRVSSRSGDEKTAQIHAKEWNWNIFLYYTQKLTQTSKDLSDRPEVIKLKKKHRQ